MYGALLPLGAVVAGLVMGIPVLILCGFFSVLAVLLIVGLAVSIGDYLQSREQRKRLRSLRP